jgi:hypothetical protein
MTREYRGASAESGKTDVGVEEGQHRERLHTVAFYGGGKSLSLSQSVRGSGGHLGGECDRRYGAGPIGRYVFLYRLHNA